MDFELAKIAIAVLSALGGGLLLSSFGHPPILGYIIAGVFLGPSGIGLISDRNAVHSMSELGVFFLMFTIGLSLSFDKLRNMWRSAMGATIVSSILSFVLLAIVLKVCRPHTGLLLIFWGACCVTLSSTAVTVKSLHSIHEKSAHVENSTFAILIAQDILALLMMLCLRFMGGEWGVEMKLRLTGSIIFVFVLVFYFLRYHRYIHRMTNFLKRHEDVMVLFTFSSCLSGAMLAEFAGLSAPFGAFTVGLILGNSNVKKQIHDIASPLEELFLVAFFLSIGLLVDFSFVVNNWFKIMIALFFVTIGKTLMNVGVFRLFKFSLKESFIMGVLLGHLGEFAFLLTSTAYHSRIISDYGRDFMISLTAISLFFSPLWLVFAQRSQKLTAHGHFSSSWDLANVTVSKEWSAMKRKLRKRFSPFHSILCAVFHVCETSWRWLKGRTRD